MKVTILKAILGWDADASPDRTEQIQRELGSLGVDIIITEMTDNTGDFVSVHNALVDEIDTSMRQELPTRDDLPVAPVAKSDDRPGMVANLMAGIERDDERMK